MRKALISGVAFVALAGQALAADLPSTKEAPVYVAPAFSWTGFYIGGNLGIGTGTSNWSNIVVPGHPGENLHGTFATDTLVGPVGGMQLGYRQQFGGFVFGIEGKYDLSDLSGSQTCVGNYGDYSAACKINNHWLADISGNIGYAMNERFLVYGKGGVAFGGSNIQPNMNPRAAQRYGNYNTVNQSSTGWVVGAGLDYAVTNNWIVGIEYDHYDFGNGAISFSQDAAALAYKNQWLVVPFGANVSQVYDTFTAKVAYKF